MVYSAECGQGGQGGCETERRGFEILENIYLFSLQVSNLPHTLQI